MAQVTSLRNNSTPSRNTGVRHIRKTLVLTNGIANNGDYIEVMKVPVKQSGFLHRMSVYQGATLGAGATLTGAVGTTAVTGATTAAAASKVDSDSDTDMPIALAGGETIQLLVGGANITAGATVIVDLYISA